MERWPFMDWDFLLVLKFCKFFEMFAFRLYDFKKYNFKGLSKVPFQTKIINYLHLREFSMCNSRKRRKSTHTGKPVALLLMFGYIFCVANNLNSWFFKVIPKFRRLEKGKIFYCTYLFQTQESVLSQTSRIDQNCEFPEISKGPDKIR